MELGGTGPSIRVLLGFIMLEQSLRFKALVNVMLVDGVREHLDQVGVRQ